MAAHGNVDSSAGSISRYTVVADSRFRVVSVADEISVVADSRFGVDSGDDVIAKTAVVKQNESIRMMLRVCTSPIIVSSVFEC